MEECGKGCRRRRAGRRARGGGGGGGGGKRGGGGGVGSGMCHPHILAASLLINFSHDQL